MVKEVLVINYYRSKNNSRGVKEVVDAIEKAGGHAKVMHHSKARRMVKRGKDILTDYDSFHATGSDISWKKKKDVNKQEYMSPGKNELAKYLVTHEKPGNFDCGSGQAAYHALGQLQEETSGSTKYRVRNTGKYNRRTIEGIKHNHKYAMDAGLKEGDLEGRIRGVTTLEHKGKKYVSSFRYGNKKVVQGHEARTEVGKIAVARFHGLKPKGDVSQKYQKKPAEYKLAA